MDYLCSYSTALLACMDGEPAVYMFIQCTPLFVEKAGVAHVRFTVHKQVCVCVWAREPPGIKTNGEVHAKSQDKCNQWPKIGLWSNIFFFKIAMTHTESFKLK